MIFNPSLYDLSDVFEGTSILPHLIIAERNVVADI